MKTKWLMVAAILAALPLAGCSGFPEVRDGLQFEDGVSAEVWFERTLAAHGGDLSEDPRDFNLAMTGEWKSTIKRIQPLVTDAGFRISAEERYRPANDLYVARHRGPEGVKTVWRRGDELKVWYNGYPVDDPDILAATAMTTDAFELFHFGPSYLARHAVTMSRLANEREGGTDYPRLLINLEPGFGQAEWDRVVAWIDPETHLLFRVHITLNGFRTTEGAHVDTTFSDYEEHGGYLFPGRFAERVRGPIRIHAHDWWITGRDLDRGWTVEDVSGPEFEGSAARAAASELVGQD